VAIGRQYAAVSSDAITLRFPVIRRCKLVIILISAETFYGSNLNYMPNKTMTACV
jgi:hypothetical protein